jgi:hypothetical protein
MSSAAESYLIEPTEISLGYLDEILLIIREIYLRAGGHIKCKKMVGWI